MLIAVLIVPILQLLLFSYAISFDVKNVPTVVLDQDKTAASRAYLQTYRSSDFFAVQGSIDDLAGVDDAFQRNLAQIAVVVPPGFARSLARGEKAQVAVMVDGTEPNAAQLGQAYAIALNQVYSNKMLVEWADRQGHRHDAARPARAARADLVQPRAQVGRLPDSGPDGGHHHDRHRPADRGDARARARSRHAGADDGEPAAAARADAREAAAVDAARRSST